MTDTKGALDGLVVVDLSTSLASAYAALVFADHGAEVIQVERPGGSELRHMRSWPFWMRGKQSIVLDLRDATDVGVARDLARGADVVIEAFGAGGADRLGLGYDVLSADNPGLVYTSITGFGHDGPYSHLRSYEAVVQAKCGAMYGNIVRSRPEEPVMLTPFGATFSASLLAIQGSFVALHERESSGHGQRVDATLVQGMMAQDPWSHFTKMIADRYPDAFTPVGVATAERRVPFHWLSFGLMNGFTKDGHWLQFAHATPQQYDDFVDALGLGWTREDARFKEAANNPDEAIRDEYWTMMLEAVRARTLDEWQEIFADSKNVFAEVYRQPLDLFDHPQMVHNGYTIEAEVTGLGTVRELGPLVQMSQTPGDPFQAPPGVDEHGAALRSRRATAPAATASATPPDRPPLDGVVVVDLGSFYAGPFGSAVLADLGATVVHVEALAGDPIRYQMPMPEVSGVRVTQGKKSLAIDAFSPEGREVLTELVGRADLVLHTYRGGVAERMGLDAETMRAQFPDVVYHHGVGYGFDGPYAKKAALAPTIGAGSGFSRRCGGGGPDGELTIDEIKDATVSMWGAQAGHPDGISALGVAAALALGLYARDRGAGGQTTMTTMLSTVGHALGDVLVDYAGAPPIPETDPEVLGFSALYRLYRASDAWIVLCAPAEDDWDHLVASLPGGVDLGSDDRFSSAEARATHDAELVERLSEIIAQRPAGEWEQSLSAAGIGCAEVVPYQGGLAMGLFEPGGVGEQLGLLAEMEHPIFGEYRRARAMVTLSRSTETLAPGCTVGQHTDEVLRDLLGYDDDRISELRASGIIG